AEGYDFDQFEVKRNYMKELVEEIGDPSVPFDSSFIQPSGEKAFDIIRGITFNTNEVIESVNLPNDGYITNLPEDAIVEVPAVVSGNGVQGIGIGKLNSGI